MNNRSVYFVLLASIVAAAQGAVTTTYAAPTRIQSSSTVSKNALSSLAPVTLQAGISARLTNIQILRKNSGALILYTLSYKNNTPTAYPLKNVFSKLKTPQGLTIKGIVLPEDKSKDTLSANSSTEISYYVNAGDAAKLGGVQVVLFGWDFNSINYEKKRGAFKLPSMYSAATSAHNQKIQINNLQFMMQPGSLQTIRYNDRLYARLPIAITNKGTEVIASPNYKTYLQSANGSLYELQLEHTDMKISPGQQKTISYVTAIPDNMNMNGSTLLLTRSDETLKAELPVISFQLTTAPLASSLVKDYAIKTIQVKNTILETQLKKASWNTSSDKAVWNLQFRIKNKGKQTITLPNYEVSVQTSEGYNFPINTSTLNGLKLKPLEEKNIQLSVSVPSTIKQRQLQLQLVETDAPTNSAASGISAPVVAEPDTGKETIRLPVAIYQIPYSEQQYQTENTEYTVDNNYGTFGVTLESLQRLPWTTEDMWVAQIRVRNAGTSSVTMPALNGLISSSDGRVSSDAQMIKERSDSNMLAAGDSTVYYVIGQFSPELDVNQLNIEWFAADKRTESADNADNKERFLTMSTGQTSSAISKINSGSAFHITTPGKKAEIKERRTLTYQGNNQKIIYTELEMQSEESRTSTPSRLVAYYRTPDNTYYEASVVQSDQAAGPKAKNLITLSAKLPESVNTSELKLYIGEGISDGKIAAPGSKITGYIHAVELALKKQAPTVTKSVSSEMELFPYKFTIVRASGTLVEGQDTISVNMTYNFSRDNTYAAGNYGHQLVIQWVDPYGQIQEKTLVPGTDLTPGQSLSYSTVLTNNSYKKSRGGNFTINVFDEFEGERIPLGSQSYNLEFVPTVVEAPVQIVPDTPPVTKETGKDTGSDTQKNTDKDTNKDTNRESAEK